MPLRPWPAWFGPERMRVPAPVLVKPPKVTAPARVTVFPGRTSMQEKSPTPGAAMSRVEVKSPPKRRPERASSLESETTSQILFEAAPRAASESMRRRPLAMRISPVKVLLPVRWTRPRPFLCRVAREALVRGPARVRVSVGRAEKSWTSGLRGGGVLRCGARRRR
jgi:hypothetical protein